MAIIRSGLSSATSRQQRVRRQPLLGVFAALGLLGLSACSDSVSPAGETPGSAQACGAAPALGHFVSVFEAAPSNTGSSFTDQTLREIVAPRFGGQTLRVRLTNRFGTQPVTFASAWVGLQGQGAGLVRGSNRKLSFACKETVTVAAGQEVLSDPLSLEFLPFQHLAVSLHVTGSSGAATQHRLGRQISYAAGVAAGNLAADESASGFDTTHNVTYFVNSVEAVAPDSTGAVVTFGDSITDGFVSTGGLATNADPAIDGADSSYPDRLARRIAAEGFGARFSVVNAGISGNRLLSDAMPGFPQFGPSGLSRLSADVIARAGVSDVILLIGTNDLGMAPPATADQVIAGLQQAVARLKAAKLNVLLATQTPSFGPVVPGGHGSPTAVAFRNQINAWVRSQTVADGVVDFHAALRDPANADALNPIYDSGDRLHPNSAGHEAMARAINLSLLRGPR